MRLINSKERDLDTTHHINKTFVVESDRPNELISVGKKYNLFIHTFLGPRREFLWSQTEPHSSRWWIGLD